MLCQLAHDTLLTDVHSILLRTIIFKAPIGAREGCIIGYESFETLSQLCFTQLVDLRHRGAFSAVAQTFAAFCRRCLSTDDKVLLVLPDRWYQVCSQAGGLKYILRGRKLSCVYRIKQAP